MVDLKQQYAEIKDEINENILAALEATQFILGPNVQAFEKEAAEYLGVKHAIGVASGTDALHLALAAAGIGPGDEVITTPFTFIATAEAIAYVGATPVFVDIDKDTFNTGYPTLIWFYWLMASPSLFLPDRIRTSNSTPANWKPPLQTKPRR